MGLSPFPGLSGFLKDRLLAPGLPCCTSLCISADLRFPKFPFALSGPWPPVLHVPVHLCFPEFPFPEFPFPELTGNQLLACYTASGLLKLVLLPIHRLARSLLPRASAAARFALQAIESAGRVPTRCSTSLSELLHKLLSLATPPPAAQASCSLSLRWAWA